MSRNDWYHRYYPVGSNWPCWQIGRKRASNRSQLILPSTLPATNLLTFSSHPYFYNSVHRRYSVAIFSETLNLSYFKLIIRAYYRISQTCAAGICCYIYVLLRPCYFSVGCRCHSGCAFWYSVVLFYRPASAYPVTSVGMRSQYYSGLLAAAKGYNPLMSSPLSPVMAQPGLSSQASKHDIHPNMLQENFL